MILWMKRLWCRVVNHPGVVREWIWSPATPLWLPDEIWTCVRCREELDHPNPSIPRYAMPRPMIDMTRYKYSNCGVVRMRAKTVDTLTRIPYDGSHD